MICQNSFKKIHVYLYQCIFNAKLDEGQSPLLFSRRSAAIIQPLILTT